MEPCTKEITEAGTVSDKEKGQNVPGHSNRVSSISLICPISLKQMIKLTKRNNLAFHEQTSSL